MPVGLESLAVSSQSSLPSDDDVLSNVSISMSLRMRTSCLSPHLNPINRLKQPYFQFPQVNSTQFLHIIPIKHHPEVFICSV